MGGRLTRGAKAPYWTKDPMAKDALVEVDETVLAALPKEMFRNQLAAGKNLFASPYDLRRGRITHQAQ